MWRMAVLGHLHLSFENAKKKALVPGGFQAFGIDADLDGVFMLLHIHGHVAQNSQIFSTVPQPTFRTAIERN